MDDETLYTNCDKSSSASRSIHPHGSYRSLTQWPTHFEGSSFQQEDDNQDSMEHSNQDQYLDQDPPLDEFDRELLAERHDERHWRASQGLVRLSLPSTSGPIRSLPAEDIEHSQGTKVPVCRMQSSSSSVGNPLSSPTNYRQKQPSKNATQDHTRRPTKASGKSMGHIPPIYRNEADVATLQLAHAPPIVQGIALVPVSNLPDRFRSIFSFPLFNAVQSKTYNLAFGSDDNLVLSAPTGSGKTVIMELAICRLISILRHGDYKIVYQAPTKSLCSERFRDWSQKFGKLDLQCAELTGDTQYMQLRNVQSASIIITTPEKWDSVTRRWKDHARLMKMIKLFLIDEVHILKDLRGAALEAVVSRMKSVDSDVRFVALSATVPNSEDIAAWLGRNASKQDLPAHREVFGEEFRPVKLEKHVYGYSFEGNDFAFDKMLDSKLPEMITKHSDRRPILVFCCTRKSCEMTAKNFAELWSRTNPPLRLWSGTSRQLHIRQPLLNQITASGVGYHHAGLEANDRQEIEKAFLDGTLSIICCTSTLAVGINLPCYLVIIKGTVAYSDQGMKEYPDLEMIQMLGRAGRPQFESSAIAAILTRTERLSHYQNLVSGHEMLESCLHLSLIDHLNAEIGLGTIHDLPSATKWLSGTFLFTRMQRNPGHYKLEDDLGIGNSNPFLEQICRKDIKLLQDTKLVTDATKLKLTGYGEAMARYYIKFETMQLLMTLPAKARMSEILSVISKATEFHELRLRVGEKSFFKEINKNNSIKFPIKVDIALASHKVSLLLQAELGGLDFPTSEAFAKHKHNFNQDKALVFQNINRLIRCVIDCQLERSDSIGARNALELARSFSARVWDSSPLQLKQLEGIGNVAVRKFASAGITSLEALEATESHQIEAIMTRNPPYGMKLLGQLEKFPNPRVSAKFLGKDSKPGQPVNVRIKAEIGFLNQKVPLQFNKKSVFVCFLAEVSDGRIIDFRRINASKLQNGHEVLLSLELNSSTQYVTCYVMCDEFAGTLRSAEVKPDLPESLFRHLQQTPYQPVGSLRERPTKDNEFDNEDVNDLDLLAAEQLAKPRDASSTPELYSMEHVISDSSKDSVSETWEPTRLSNGKWKCNHTCKNRNSCKHLCCREGLDKKPKPPKSKPPKNITAKDHIATFEGKTQSLLDFKSRDTLGKHSSLPQVDHRQGPEAINANKENVHETSATTEKLPNRAQHPAFSQFEQTSGLDITAPAAGSLGQKHRASGASSDYDCSWADEIDIDDLPDPERSPMRDLSPPMRKESPIFGEKEIDFTDPDIASFLETADTVKQSSGPSRRKRTVDDANMPSHEDKALDRGHVGRKRPKVSSDYWFEDEDLDSSETMGQGLEYPWLSGDTLIKAGSGILPSSSPAGETVPMTRVTMSPKRPRSPIDMVGVEYMTANQAVSHLNVLRDVTNASRHGNRIEDEQTTLDEEQAAKWEGFDPELIAEFKDIVELL